MDSKTYYTRLAVTVGAVLLVMVAARVLFWSPAGKRPGASNGPVSRGAGRRSDGTASRSADGSREGGVISWRDAAEHYGQTCTVEGEIVATYNSGKACFLNFHPNWRRHFTAVIFASSFDQFPPNPEEHYKGKRVRVTGRIVEYEGRPEIILDTPGQIEVVE